MSELLSEIIIDLRDESNILNCIRVNRLYLREILKNLNYKKIYIITDFDIKIDDERVIIINNSEKLENIIKIEKNTKLIKILSIVLFVIIIIFLITIENIWIFVIVSILILIRDNLSKIVNIFYKKKVII
jgi:hypothetical protein